MYTQLVTFLLALWALLDVHVTNKKVAVFRVPQTW